MAIYLSVVIVAFGALVAYFRRRITKRRGFLYLVENRLETYERLTKTIETCVSDAEEEPQGLCLHLASLTERNSGSVKCTRPAPHAARGERGAENLHAAFDEARLDRRGATSRHRTRRAADIER